MSGLIPVKVLVEHHYNQVHIGNFLINPESDDQAIARDFCHGLRAVADEMDAEYLDKYGEGPWT